MILSLLLAFTSIGGVDGLRVLADDTIPAESSEIITETEKEQSMENAEEADMTGTKEDDSQDEQAQKTTGASENIEQEEYQSTDVSKGDANNQGQADPQIIDAEKSEETSGSQTESQEKQSEEDDVSYPKFYQEKTVSGVRITVSADEGVFPEGSSLSVKKVSRGEESRVDNAISGVREGEVVSQYTFDIKILKDGMEIQPKGDVSVSFKLEEVENTNLETSVYHVDREYNVNSMDIEENEGVVTVVTDGFSIYTVEFTYGDKQFVLAGDWYVKLEDLLYAVDLSGEVSSWEISDEELFDIVMGNEDGPRLIYTYISDGVPVVLDEDDENYGKVSASYTVVNDPEGDVPWVVARKPFTSEEWLDVTMDDGITYRIVVTDAIMGNNTVNQNIPGLSQGENLTNFAPLIPVADIWIDSSKFYAQSGFVNGTWDTFEPGPLMTAENSPFKVDNPAGSSKASSYQGRHFVYYDSSVKPLDGYIATTRKSDGATVYQSYNYFEGRVGTYTWRNAAVRLKEDGTEERLHVCIDYSNPLITLQPVKGATSEANFIVTDPENINSWNDVNVGLFGGNAVTAGAKKYNAATDKYEGFDERYGLQITAKPYVIDDNGNVVNAKIYFPMVDLDVNRSTGGGFAGFYKGNSLLTNYDETLRRYSEGAQVNEGLVLNSSGDRLYIPGSDGTYKSIVGYDNGSYRVSSGPTGDVDPGTFNTGFLALIQNGEFKTTVTGSGGTNGGSVITYVMAGSEYNYRLRHSTETLKPDGTSEADGTKGGTIRTTREGNHNGELNDGQIIEPSMIASAVGQTIVYTFTPEPGYALNAVYVWNDTDKTTLDFPSIDSMKTLTKIREGDGSNNTFVAHDDNHDGIVDRYTYSFVAINEDNAIHVVWVKTSLSIRKAVTGSGATNDTFTFTIKAWGDSDEDGVIEYVDFANDSDMGALASEFTSVGNNLYQFTLESGETINIPEGVIPFGFEYEVEEIQVNGKYGTLDGWSPVSATVQSGQLTDENPHGKANFTNRRKKTTDPNKTLTVKKVWSNDIETIRPRNITVNVQNEIVALNVNSYALRNQIESLFGGQTQMRNQLTGFRYGTKEDAENATQKYVFEDAALTYGTIPVYIYKDGTDICIYSDAEIYFDGSMDNLFYECRQLTDISGLANIHTDFVTSFVGTFGRCINLTNLAPLADWNVTSATSMSQMFIGVGISEANKMTLSDLTPLADWDTRNVTNMSQMFRYSNVADLSPIAGWDVGRVTTMNYMFQHTKASTVDNRALDEWDPGLCTGWTAVFQYSNNTSNTALTVQQRANLPVFTKRTGTWSSAGAYQNVQGTHQSGSPGTKPTDAKTSNLNQKGLLLSQTAHDVDPSDPTGNTWIYEFEIPEGAYWKVWEVLPDGYAPYYSIDEVTYQAPGKEAAVVAPNENGQFGSADNPLTGAVPQSVTVIKNKRNTHELRIKKDAASSTNEKFTFTLRLWSVSESNTYDLPDNHPKLLDGSIKKIAPGTYEFTLIPPGSEALILPAGIRYRVTETPAKG